MPDAFWYTVFLIGIELVLVGIGYILDGIFDMKKRCERGHVFEKSSSCPVCPECWKGYYRSWAQRDFPTGLGAPALRALQNAGITELKKLAKWKEEEVLDLHGMGPKGLKLLKKALEGKGMGFKGE